MALLICRAAEMEKPGRFAHNGSLDLRNRAILEFAEIDIRRGLK